MVKWLFLGLAAALITFAFYLYFHLGLNKPVEITVTEAGPFVLIYKEHMGAYHEIGPVIREVENWAIKNNVPCPRTFGEYLDDPSTVDQDRLRSLGGCQTLTVPGELPEGFKTKEIPRKNYVMARFSGSPAIGPYAVYPKVKDFFHEKRMKMPASVIEFYLVSGRNVETEFLFEIP